MQHLDKPADNAVYGIIAANALTLVMALWQHWALLGLLWPFWIQSVIIGWYARQRILKLQQFSTEGLKMNDQPVAETPEARDKVANFFLLHYGFFHLVYLVFLLVATFGSADDGMLPVTQEGSDAVMLLEVGKLGLLDLLLFLGLGVAFWRSHRASHLEHVRSDLAGRPNLGTLMFLPYARVIPMHMTIVIGAQMAGGALWLFVVLKTIADVIMHKVEHRTLQQAGAASRPEGKPAPRHFT